jgi:hypothetical protein
MIYSVHRDPKFDECLDMLRERGGAALIAVKKAEELINRIMLKGREHSVNIGKQTKNGEFRIKRCIKYDLGNGYRLICVKKGSRLAFLFMGTHDDCGRWIKRKRGLNYKIDTACNYDSILLTIDPSVSFAFAEEIDAAEEYEENLMRRVDDKILRTIFCGLVASISKH